MDSVSVVDNAATMRANIFVVGIGNQTVEGLMIKRNIGFTWEAGRFLAFLYLPCFLIYHFIICLFHGGKTVLFIY